MVDSVSPALARRIALAAQGFGRPLPEVAGHPPGRRGGRPSRAAADRLGQRVRAQPLPAGVQPRRRLRQGRCSTGSRWAVAAACSSTGRTRRRSSRVSCGRCSSSGARSTAQSGSEWGGWLVENRDARRLAARRARRQRADARRARSSTTPTSAAGRGGAGPTSSARSSGCSASARSSASSAAASSASTPCPSRRSPAELLGEPPAEADAVRELVRRAARRPRHRDRGRPRRLLAHEARAASARRSATSKTPACSSRSRCRAGAIGGRPAPDLAAPRRPPPAPDRGRGRALAVRPGGVVPPAHRAPVRLPLPHRDLHARARSQVRLLLAAGAHRRRRRRPGRPQERPQGGGAARAVGVDRAGRAGRDRGAARAGAAAGGGVAGPRRHRGRRPRRPAPPPVRAALVGG